MVMSSNCHTDEAGTVPRRQQDGSRIPITCPESIIKYKYMGGVDCRDKIRGYYNRTKSRKFYKYIYTFLLDVCNHKCIHPTEVILANPFNNHKNFRLQLAKELVGEYCSRRRCGRGEIVIHTLPYHHFPIKMKDEDNRPKRRRGRCAFHAASHTRATTLVIQQAIVS